jgi:hypothetical protein
VTKAAFAILCAAAATAHADAKKDVDALVRAEVQAALDNYESQPPRTDDFFNWGGSHRSSTPLVNMYGHFASNITHKVEKIVVVVEPELHAAWFHAIVDGSYDWTPCDANGEKCEKSTKRHTTWRLSGVARDDHGWKLRAQTWSETISDAELFKRADTRKPPELYVADDEAARVVASWFDGTGSIAKDMSSRADVIANGTAPAEIGQGAAAGKLAKAWDALGLRAQSILGKHSGSIAVVFGWIRLDDKKRKDYTAVMGLLAVLVQEKGAWKWVQINFSPPSGD